MPCDVFVSYSRRDNTNGRVTELVEHIAGDDRQLCGEALLYFFDKHDIQGMNVWRHTILDGLKQSHLFLLVLSPEYQTSPYCEWEIVEYLKYESARAVLGEGVAPIYFVTIPALDEPGFGFLGSGNTILNSDACPSVRVSGVSRSGPGSVPGMPIRPRHQAGGRSARGPGGLSNPLPESR
ncbi:MAG: toll/interleukin-1 receptor domain-containing protein [Isosphaerales bacterium]